VNELNTGGRTHNVIVFPSIEHGECSYGPEYFAAHSEHVTLESACGAGRIAGQMFSAERGVVTGWEGTETRHSVQKPKTLEAARRADLTTSMASTMGKYEGP
jgi:hypothetical protein